MGLSSTEKAELLQEALSLGSDLAKAAAGGLSFVEIAALAPKLLVFVGKCIKEAKD
jgi:hypothetical protein